jgi:hypothetical protein
MLAAIGCLRLRCFFLPALSLILRRDVAKTACLAGTTPALTGTYQVWALSILFCIPFLMYVYFVQRALYISMCVLCEIRSPDYFL